MLTTITTRRIDLCLGMEVSHAGLLDRAFHNDTVSALGRAIVHRFSVVRVQILDGLGVWIVGHLSSGYRIAEFMMYGPGAVRLQGSHTM